MRGKVDGRWVVEFQPPAVASPMIDKPFEAALSRPSDLTSLGTSDVLELASGLVWQNSNPVMVRPVKGVRVRDNAIGRLRCCRPPVNYGTPTHRDTAEEVYRGLGGRRRLKRL